MQENERGFSRESGLPGCTQVLLRMECWFLHPGGFGEAGGKIVPGCGVKSGKLCIFMEKP